MASNGEADGGKKPLSRDQLMKYIKNQKIQLKKVEEARDEALKELEAFKSSGDSVLTPASDEIVWRDTELKARGDRIRELSISLEERDKRIEELSSSENEKLQQQLDEFEQTKDELNRYRIGVDSLSQQLAVQSEEVEKLKAELEKYQTTDAASSTAGKCDDLNNQVIEFKKKCGDQEKEIDDFKTQLTQWKSKVRYL
jgi:predicted RNase H-like nuclease (RuvC/YqgF family)